MLTGPEVILLLKVAVGVTTFILIASLVALALKRPRLHGVLNVVLTVLLFVAVIGFETAMRVMGVDVTAHMDEAAKAALTVHLWFSVPLLPAVIGMLLTGKKRRIRWHLGMSLVFVVLWVGMFVTGMFFLPHHNG